MLYCTGLLKLEAIIAQGRPFEIRSNHCTGQTPPSRTGLFWLTSYTIFRRAPRRAPSSTPPRSSCPESFRWVTPLTHRYVVRRSSFETFPVIQAYDWGMPSGPMIHIIQAGIWLRMCPIWSRDMTGHMIHIIQAYDWGDPEVEPSRVDLSKVTPPHALYLAQVIYSLVSQSVTLKMQKVTNQRVCHN